MLKPTTAQSKIARLKKRVRVVQGGTSSSKTFSIIPLLIQYALQTPNSEISIVAESIPHLKRGAMRDFTKIMQWVNIYNDASFNKSNLIYTFDNSSFIEFFSADQPDKLRGARRDVLFINECNNVTFEAYQQLSIRTKKFIYLDYNPTSEFWVHTELINQPNTDFVILTYKDNEALDPAIVKEIEAAREKAATSTYWANWWRVYGLGELGNLEGVIFSNWKIIDNVPNGARLVGIGVDFGYSVDPTSIIEVYTYNGQRVLNERAYSTGLLNSDIARLLPAGVAIYADSAEPKSIDEIRNFGLSIMGVTKGRDSISYGIDVMQRQDYLVTANSVNLIKELRQYCWDVDRQGKRVNVPAGVDHAIDAVRYHEMETLGLKANYGKYAIR